MTKMQSPGNFPNQLYGWQVDTDGTWTLYAANGTATLRVGATGLISFLNVPSADPHVVGQIYTSAAAVKVSAG